MAENNRNRGQQQSDQGGMGDQNRGKRNAESGSQQQTGSRSNQGRSQNKGSDQSRQESDNNRSNRGSR